LRVHQIVLLLLKCINFSRTLVDKLFFLGINERIDFVESGSVSPFFIVENVGIEVFVFFAFRIVINVSSSVEDRS